MAGGAKEDRSARRQELTVVMATGDLMRLRSGAEHLHRLGPRAIAELLIELGNVPTALELLNRYRRMTPQLLQATGGDRFPPHIQGVPDDL